MAPDQNLDALEAIAVEEVKEAAEILLSDFPIHDQHVLQKR